MKGEKTGMKGGGFVDDKRFSTSTDFEHLLPLAMKEGKLPGIKMLSVSIRGWIVMEYYGMMSQEPGAVHCSAWALEGFTLLKARQSQQ